MSVVDSYLHFLHRIVAVSVELSVESIARILCFVPLSPVKLAMQGVTMSFQQAVQTPQAHAGTTEVTFPFKHHMRLAYQETYLGVMPFVCLGPRQKDFSGVAVLDHLQALACDYGALHPVSPCRLFRS